MATMLSLARARRTKQANVVKRQMQWMLTELAPIQYNGLPSWWPFWSDSLYENTKNLYQAARKVEAIECQGQAREVMP